MMIGNEVDKYMAPFNELSRMVPHMVSTEEKRVDRYIWGLVPEVRRMVTSSNPITLQDAVGMAYRLTNDETAQSVTSASRWVTLLGTARGMEEIAQSVTSTSRLVTLLVTARREEEIIGEDQHAMNVEVLITSEMFARG
uniref:Zinc finger, CCHC-type, retrotransposon Gag domain protein n=1 Tax=Tanacetum cinerariifolium TaxID=118510 RepID=A0A699HZB7_TANCI|nr:zinc finger, CCHC-type, retrotransposon Gag domain protein [Tanacetum cinerariifolium]